MLCDLKELDGVDIKKALILVDSYDFTNRVCCEKN